ncbi:hypothetical protein [Ornithinimicrobium tianjinense]|uniref:Uncharacterized protein n=1 Tax=Ornithinimicrobium tianjinense TaxID=1195761 RepID=A0A917BW75_9MICO|nr:hypothetical protein [Ornithinimicrobium tianjinense]GGF59878.1 hypothetical protein GCM10011366_29620 [Ornithinimicrobium tianjinense]
MEKTMFVTGSRRLVGVTGAAMPTPGFSLRPRFGSAERLAPVRAVFGADLGGATAPNPALDVTSARTS